MQNFIVFSSNEFDLLNECAYYEEMYRDLGIGIDERLYAINSPFLMDSQFEAMKREGRRLRKRRKHDCLTVTSNKEVARIERIAKEVREAGCRLGFFFLQTTHDNNRIARDAVRELMERRFEMYNHEAIVSNEITIIDDNREFVVEDEFCMLNSWYRNNSNRCIRLNISKTVSEAPSVYYVPPNATFHIGCVSDVRNFTAINDEKFDLIIMDPPWINRSMIRQKNYVINDSVLYQIEMGGLVPTGLVVVWITNREGIEHDLAVHFKRWGIRILATFYWLKKTSLSAIHVAAL
ncbi:hypothetical protein KIN20_009420 [Parelaphostrongylus tenuis]|uniref:Uncharacterized protein n=1 Tax=Parelaphostrongylus tenuis TaxID=148309 RepID=A0AAD5QND0_PARTN|nr:hypothetical protein KIN20_009420 [Parelaphostrongylus tenuis]